MCESGVSSSYVYYCKMLMFRVPKIRIWCSTDRWTLAKTSRGGGGVGVGTCLNFWYNGSQHVIKKWTQQNLAI